MKTIKSFILLGMSLLCMQANAQTDLTSLSFVDKAGNAISDGTELTCTEVENDNQGNPQILTGLFVKNNTSDEVATLCHIEVEKMDNGVLSCCFPATCQEAKSVGETSTTPNVLDPEETRDFLTEWKPATYGVSTATFQLYIQEIKMVYNPVIKIELPDYETFKAFGPKVKINFIYSDPASINGVSTDGAKVEAFYTMSGQQINAPLANGVTLVKYTNGKTIKMIQK